MARLLEIAPSTQALVSQPATKRRRIASLTSDQHSKSSLEFASPRTCIRMRCVAGYARIEPNAILLMHRIMYGQRTQAFRAPMGL